MLEGIYCCFFSLSLTSSNQKQTHTVSSVNEHVEEFNTTLSSRPCCASQEPALSPLRYTVNAWQTTGDSPARRKKALFAGMTKMNCSFY